MEDSDLLDVRLLRPSPTSMRSLADADRLESLLRGGVGMPASSDCMCCSVLEVGSRSRSCGEEWALLGFRIECMLVLMNVDSLRAAFPFS